MQHGKGAGASGLLWLAALLAWAGTVQAGVIIESTSARSGPGKVMIDGDRARIDSGDAGTYMLLDLESQKVLAVNVGERFAMDLTSPLPRPSRHAEMSASSVRPPDVRLERSGAGPAVAGFATTRYRVMVDDTHCRDELLASGPLDDPGIRRFVSTMAAASSNEQRMILMLLTDEDRVCDAADDLVDDHYPELGIPMRTVGPDGEVLHQIDRIRLDAEVPGEALELPADIPVLTRAQIRERDSAPDPEALRRRRQHILQRMRELEREARPENGDEQP